MCVFIIVVKLYLSLIHARNTHSTIPCQPEMYVWRCEQKQSQMLLTRCKRDRDTDTPFSGLGYMEIEVSRLCDESERELVCVCVCVGTSIRTMRSKQLLTTKNVLE